MGNWFFLLLFLFSKKEVDKIIGDWCYTIYALEAFKAKASLQRPNLSGPVEYIEGDRFRVHYTRSGSDAVSRAYAESVASYIAHSFRLQVDSLNWAPPPPDFGLGGDDRYDIYIKALPSGIGGYCAPEYSYPNPYPDGATSYIAVANNLSIGGFLKVVCAHEFNHACQFRYSSEEESFWYENTAVWMEDVCYEEINDYVGYLSSSPGPLTTPYYPINTFIQGGLYQYAGGIWAMYLEDRFDTDCLRKIWERQGVVNGNNTLEGFDYVLRNFYNSNLNNALKEYGIWRYFTGQRAIPDRFFKEGNLWPMVSVMSTHNSYPCQGNSSSYEPVVPGGADYINFLNGGGKFFLFFDGDDGFNWQAIVIGYKREEPRIYELNLNSQAQGNDSFDWRYEDNFVLIPIVAHWEYGIGYQLNFNYSGNIRILFDVGVEEIRGFPSIADSHQLVYPNVLIKNYGQRATDFSVRLTCGNFYSDIRNISLNPNDTQRVYFLPCTLKARNYQYYRCTTLLYNDERPSNNLKEGRIFVKVEDCGVESIIEPSGNISQGSYIQLKAIIKNYGNLRAEFNVIFAIGDWQTIKRISIPANTEILVIFDSLWYAATLGEHLAKCSTALANDLNRNNDKKEIIFYVTLPAVEENNFFNNLKDNDFSIFDIKGSKVNTNYFKKGIYFLKNRKQLKKIVIK
jgi:hypothetical protein